MTKMEITANVIRDLLPMYLDGEVSQDTRRLVEAYLEAHPELRREAEAPVRLERVEVRREVDDALAVMEKTKRAIQRQKWLQFWGLLFSLIPLSFAFSVRGVNFWLLRDMPVVAGVFWAGAAVLWYFYWRGRQG
jgi:anti-sigma factor RsiW